MSFDIFLQGFENGEGAAGRAEEGNAALQPYLRSSAEGHTRVVTDDGEAEVYGVGSAGLMFTHVSGRRIWDVIYEVARAASWAIIPVGCPTCVPAEEMVAHLPDELRTKRIGRQLGRRCTRCDPVT